ncbi:MAG TPA: biotin/lipoyl-binding carrier protein [Egibacteraceae bacterium]|nr:biotin/lipoyl-binding carrier protein [Actinomycetota bacterium]HWB73020.1 biotin/lipoyl-binding carrier protein [Egibacteraceae bacterium]
MIEVVAQMVASVIAVGVAPGQRVVEGDTLLVVESMKMEIPVRAPTAGTVAELRVATEDVVVEGDVLAVIEPEPKRSA